MRNTSFRIVEAVDGPVSVIRRIGIRDVSTKRGDLRSGMAILDDKNGLCVVRIVYDGPPFSGKTTTLRSLSERLSRPMESPEEHDGRTLYFDWLDYTAGRYEGRPICCQVVTVPGQRSFVERRKRLLREADSVVFVADTGSIGIDLSLKYARELGDLLSGLDEPRPGVIIGANKRDVEDAMPVGEIIDKFRQAGLDSALIETTATAGTGVREAFLFGVRLALDRVRELSRRGMLKSGSPTINSCGDLLEQLTTRNDDSPRDRMRPTQEAVVSSTPAAVESTLQVQAPETAPSDGGDIVLPDPSVPSGQIWPPIEGRIILQQALVTGKLKTQQSRSGNLCAISASAWAIHSRRDDVFEDQAEARSALLEWASLHVRNSAIVTERRCIVLSPDRRGWRLWQVVPTNCSIDTFLAAAEGATIRQRVEHLLVAGRKLLRAANCFSAASVSLPVTTAVINTDSSEPRYAGLMPRFSTNAGNSAAARPDDDSVLSKGLGRHIRALRGAFQSGEIAAELDAAQANSPENAQVAGVLRNLLTASGVGG